MWGHCLHLAEKWWIYGGGRYRCFPTGRTAAIQCIGWMQQIITKYKMRQWASECSQCENNHSCTSECNRRKKGENHETNELRTLNENFNIFFSFSISRLKNTALRDSLSTTKWNPLNLNRVCVRVNSLFISFFFLAKSPIIKLYWCANQKNKYEFNKNSDESE